MPTNSPQKRKLRISYAVLLIFVVIFTLFEELYFRRWLFHHFGFNSVIAGSFPNFLAVVLFSVGIVTFRLPENDLDAIRTPTSIVIGLTLYEIAQIWMPHRVFDWNDIAATLLGGVFSWLLILIPQKIFAASLVPTSSVLP